MERRAIQKLGMIIASGLFSLSSLAATLVNGGFEAGNFNGWNLEMPRGISQFQPRYRNAGTAGVLSTWSTGTGMPDRQPQEGSFFAALGSLSDGHFRGNQKYNITLSQEFSLRAGDSISGLASFYNGDYTSQDSAWVKILDASGCVIATPWREFSGGIGEHDRNSVAYRDVTAWTGWDWSALEDGIYTIRLGMTTDGDNCMSSYGFFDKLVVNAAPIMVPEPSATAILMMGLGGFAALQKFRKRF